MENEHDYWITEKIFNSLKNLFIKTKIGLNTLGLTPHLKLNG